VAAARAAPAKVAAKVAAPLMATAPAKVAAPVNQSLLKQQRRSSCGREGVSRTMAAEASMETGAAGPANGSSSKQQLWQRRYHRHSRASEGSSGTATVPAKAAAKVAAPEKRQKHVHRWQYQ
jgi:hypothetical protein